MPWIAIKRTMAASAQSSVLLRLGPLREALVALDMNPQPGLRTDRQAIRIDQLQLDRCASGQLRDE